MSLIGLHYVNHSRIGHFIKEYEHSANELLCVSCTVCIVQTDGKRLGEEDAANNDVTGFSLSPTPQGTRKSGTAPAQTTSSPPTRAYTHSLSSSFDKESFCETVAMVMSLSHWARNLTEDQLLVNPPLGQGKGGGGMR